MNQTFLTVELVEDIHRALQNGRSISHVTSNLERASLPAIMEYGCLRWLLPEAVPPLPAVIARSAVGQALTEVRSELGLRNSGPEKTSPRDIRPREVEFQVIKDENDVRDNQLFEEYLLRFEFAAKRSGLPHRTAVELNAALCEMASNAATHARTAVPALAGYEVRGQVAVCCVVDVGIGVLESLRTNPAYRHLSVHTEAIRHALHDGVSSVVGLPRRGFGFHQVFKSLAAEWGQLRFRSGEGCLSMNGYGLDADQGYERDLPYLNGFQVAVCCRATPPPRTLPRD